MTTNRPVKIVREWLIKIAPQTFWFSIGFGLFNTIVGISAFNIAIFKTVTLVSAIPIRMWAVVFLIHGLALLGSLFIRDWRTTQYLHVVGIVIKTGWWFEMLSFTLRGNSPFLFYTWTLLIFLQFTVFLYFAPRISRD